MKQFADELLGICRLVAAFERDALCCGGLVTVPQCVVLQELLTGERDLGGLAARVGSSQSAMTRLVDGLVKKGWVSRSRPPDDRRRVVATLTAAGREQAIRLRGMTEQAVAAVLERVPLAKHGQILESLRLIREAMAADQDWRGCC